MSSDSCILQHRQLTDLASDCSSDIHQSDSPASTSANEPWTLSRCFISAYVLSVSDSRLLQSNPAYNTSSIHAFVHDLTTGTLALKEQLAAAPPEFWSSPTTSEVDVRELPERPDVISCIFVLSALPPTKQADAVRSLVSVRSCASSQSPEDLTPCLTGPRAGWQSPSARLCSVRRGSTAFPRSPVEGIRHDSIALVARALRSGLG